MESEADATNPVAWIHDQVAVYVKHLDDFMRDLSPDQAAALVDDARRLLTVTTFLRDATIELLETGGAPVEDDMTV